MKIFLVRAKIRESPYMNDPKEYEDIHIVMAENKNEACEKYEMFWEKKNEAYCVSYYVNVIQCSEAIQ